MTTTTSTNESTARGGRVRRIAAVLLAILSALATWYVLTAVLRIDLVATGVGAVAWSAVLVAALVAGLAGWLVLAALERAGGHVRRRWTMIALAVLLLSLPAPLAQGATWAAGLGLAVLHLVVGAVLVPVLARTARP